MIHRGNPEFDNESWLDKPPGFNDFQNEQFGLKEPESEPELDVRLSPNDPLWKIQDELVSVNRANGFVWTADEIPKAIALCHSELSEALDEDRERKPGWEDRFATEIADTIIRCLDIGGQLNLPIIECMISKIARNATRGHKHGGKRY